MEPSLPLIEKQGGVPFFWPDWLVLCYNLSVEWHSLFSWQLGLVKLSVKWLHFVITVWNIQIIFISRSLKIELFCQQYLILNDDRTRPCLQLTYNDVLCSTLFYSKQKVRWLLLVDVEMFRDTQTLAILFAKNVCSNLFQ